MMWGSTNCNDRGVVLLEFLNFSNLEILNQGTDPTYCSAGRLEVIWITLGYFGLLESFKSREYSSDLSLSNHRRNPFTLEYSTGATDRESQGYHLGLLSRGTERRNGKGPRNEHERWGWITACNSFCPAGPNLGLWEQLPS